MSLSFLPKLFSRARWLFGAIFIIGACWLIRHWAGAGVSTAAPSPSAKTTSPGKLDGITPSGKKEAAIVALVNGETITRDDLAKECLRHHGKDVLESLVNRRLIEKHCRDNGITVTSKEIDDEIDRIARKFKLPKDQYLKLIEKERGIRPGQYGRDIIWPTLALRKLAAPKLVVSKAELEQAYESQFGTAVKVRMIALEDRAKAQQVLAMVKQKPEEFGAIARKESVDVNSASSNGLIQPIRRHLGDPEIEQAAFKLQPGDISPVIEVSNQFVILKCDELLAPVNADRQHFDPLLIEAIRERKLRAAAAETFQALQKSTKVENIMNDAERGPKMPGVAALINGEQITLTEVGEQAVERYGIDVLDGMVNRRLLEQTLKRRKLTITDDDLRAEVERAAISMGKTLPDGQADIPGWLEIVKQTQGIGKDIYVNDVVWPSTAMKVVVGDKVPITNEDVKKGFEANYGPRVRCRAIVFNDQRKAQQVWDMARQNLTVKKFGDLAEQYSIEANSRSLRGEVPPIQKYGGQPVMEREAFALQPGELSGVIQVGDTYVILLCEGYTKPIDVDIATVREKIYDDLHEKKQRMAMADEFEKLKANATIDNYLAGTVHSPKKEKELLSQDALETPKPRSARQQGPAATVRSPKTR